MLIIDTETTGNEPPEVIELAYLDPDSIVAPIVRRFKPTKRSAYGALATHHILDEELEGLAQSPAAMLPSTDFIIGHNIDYDWAALGKPEVRRICTLAIARKLYSDCDSHSLGAMLYRLSEDHHEARRMLKEAHSAAADVIICMHVLSYMLADNGKGALRGEELWKFSEACRIPDIISFGKHKGARIKDLPRDYKSWMLKQPDMDPYVLKAIRESLQK